MNESIATEEHMRAIFVGLRETILDYSRCEAISKTLPYPKPEDFGETMSKVKKGGMWFYHPETLVERYTKDVLPDPWMRGRSPKTKHGGKRGEYTPERYAKNRIHVKGLEHPLYGKKRSEEDCEKMRQAAKLRHIIQVCCLCCQRTMNYGSFCNHNK